MKSEACTEPVTQNEAESDINELVMQVKKETRSIASGTKYERIDILQVFVGKLLNREGVLSVEETPQLR